MYFNGTKSCALILSCLLSLSLGAKDVKTVNTKGLNKPLCFVENKGQVKDQDNNPRADIQYKLSSPGMSLFVGNGQLHYLFQKIEGKPSDPDATATSYRMDVTLVGANPNAQVVSAEEQAYYENYFMANGGNEALTVHSFDKVIYKDVYPNIDWVLYVKNGKVEYDFVVRPGGNTHDIQLKYDGTTALSITKNGSLSAETPLGSVKEKTPYSFETATGNAIASNFVVHNNIVSFETAPYTGSLTIDPSLEWSTYFGGNLEDVATSVKATTTGFTFVGGYTSTTTLGFGPALHSTMLGGAYDGFLAKYTPTGTLLYTTYFGGSLSDKVTAITLDNTGAGNPFVYLAGITNSTSIAPGPFTVAAYHGGDDGFIAKLNNAGSTLSWCTYYGGGSNDYINAITCDASNNIYVTGRTNSVASIATTGVFQTSLSGINDAFAAKFSGAAGSLTWGTYLGGTAQEEGFGIALDNTNNVFVTGQTNSIVNIASTGAHQTTLTGTNDAFLIKLNPTGTGRIWGTYLGGTGQEQGNSIACDQTTGAIALIGNTTSTNNIATVNAFQTAYAGGPQDAFVTYFSNAGVRTWGTYFGGSMPEYGQSVCIDNANNIVIAGGTFSTIGISSPYASQPSKDGDYDAYVAKFNIRGQRIWSSYFGGTFYDLANAVTVDNNNQIILAGYTTSSPSNGIYGSGGIATAGGAQTTYSGGTYDAFVTKFETDVFVEINTPFNDVLVCAGGTLNVGYTTNGTFQPGNVFTVQLSDGTGSFLSPVNIGSVTATTSGTITTVIPSGTPTLAGYRIRIIASNPAYISPDNYANISVVSSLPAPVATGTSPVCIGGVISLSANASYSISGYSWSGPAMSGFSGTGFTSNIKNPFNNGLSGLGVTKNDEGIYNVIVSHNGCPDMVASVSIVVNDVFPPDPTISAPALNCARGPLNLSSVPGTSDPALQYNWTGPAGFTSTLRNPVISPAMVANSGIYTLTNVLNGCPSVIQSMSVTVTDNIFDSVRIVVSPDDTVCRGTLVTFTAIPSNGGVSPIYQWMTGGMPIVGAVSSVFSSSTLVDGETIYCTMKSSLTCPYPVVPVSNGIKMNVISNPPIVKIFSTNPNVNKGDSVVFTSAIYNGGTSPLYQWKRNGVDIPEANGDRYVLYNVTGPVTITLELTSTMVCSVPNYGLSNPITAGTNVGVTQISAAMDNIELFPNPNTGTFSVKGDYNSAATTLSVDIINAIGQVVYNTSVTPQGNSIDKTISLKNIPSGVYLMRISDNDQSKTLRFTVSK